MVADGERGLCGSSSSSEPPSITLHGVADEATLHGKEGFGGFEELRAGLGVFRVVDEAQREAKKTAAETAIALPQEAQQGLSPTGESADVGITIFRIPTDR